MTNPDEISRDAQAGTPLHDRIAMLGVGACSCSTKPPDLHAHMGWCIYRRAIELSEQAESEIDALTTENAALKERVKELEPIVRNLLAWWDNENAGPDYHSQTRDTHPDGERIWREWWDRNLRLADVTHDMARAALEKKT